LPRFEGIEERVWTVKNPRTRFYSRHAASRCAEVNGLVSKDRYPSVTEVVEPKFLSHNQFRRKRRRVKMGEWSELNRRRNRARAEL
jgi:hypothetical protein